MRLLRRAVVLGSFGISLAVTANVLAQAAEKTTARDAGVQGQSARPSRDLGGGNGTENRLAASKATVGAPGDAAAKQRIEVGRGEGTRGQGVRSDVDKKEVRGKRHSRASSRVDPALPLAQAPSFEMRPDGTSVVTLTLSRSTGIARLPQAKGARSDKNVEFQLENVQIGVKNNSNPLVTEHFPTPLRRVVLRRAGKGAKLRLELRESVQVTLNTKAGPAGSILLEVVLPKPSRAYPNPSSRPTKNNEDFAPRGAKHRGRSGEDGRDGDAPGPTL